MTRIATVLAVVTITTSTAALAGDAPIIAERVALGVTAPVYVTHIPGNYDYAYIVQRGGQIRVLDITVNPPVLLPTPFMVVSPIVSGGEQGLLGLAFHPDFENNNYFYVYYTSPSTVIRRYTANSPLSGNSSTGTTLLTIGQPFSNHNGGWIGFGPNDGYLYIATGDGGSGNDPGNRAQDITNQLLGKMLRIDVDGGTPYGIPADNPFVGVTGDDEIWAYGLRNPWRNAFDTATGDLYIGDVGQGQWEEISFQPGTSTGGENYGWRCMEGDHCTGLSGCTCNSSSLVDPIHEYSHGGSPFRCSITGGEIYRGCAIPEIDGTYFFGDYCSEQIWSLQYDGSSVSNFQDRTSELDPPGSQAVDDVYGFGRDAYGELYICDGQSGEVFRIIREGGLVSDCNDNGIEDACDLVSGNSLDEDGNDLPDECLPPCKSIADCADDDNDGIRDDGCVFWVCDHAECVSTDIKFADMGGQFGSCVVDGTSDNNDRNHALNCFADEDTNGKAGAYPCETPPNAYNVDTGGEFGSCQPDGVCDGNDAFAALNAFEGVSNCACPADGSPSPEAPVVVVARTGLRAVANVKRAAPGDLVEVDVYTTTALFDLRGYQLHLAPTGGRSGTLELVDIAVSDGAALENLGAWQAFSLHAGQMVVGLDSAGVQTAAGAYLATYTYRVGDNAAGTFVIELLADQDDTTQRTFLFPTLPNGQIAVKGIESASVTVVPRRLRTR